MSDYETVSLYGGAITVGIPIGMVDASSLRPVPDTQEVFIRSNSDTSVSSIIFDLLECVDGSTLTEILDEHIEEVARFNNVSQYRTIEEQTVAGEDPLCTSPSGYRIISSDKSSHDHSIILVLRLKAPASTDVLITINGFSSNVAEKVAHSFKVRDVSLFSS